MAAPVQFQSVEVAPVKRAAVKRPTPNQPLGAATAYEPLPVSADAPSLADIFQPMAPRSHAPIQEDAPSETSAPPAIAEAERPAPGSPKPSVRSVPPPNFRPAAGAPLPASVKPPTGSGSVAPPARRGTPPPKPGTVAPPPRAGATAPPAKPGTVAPPARTTAPPVKPGTVAPPSRPGATAKPGTVAPPPKPGTTAPPATRAVKPPSNVRPPSGAFKAVQAAATPVQAVSADGPQASPEVSTAGPAPGVTAAGALGTTTTAPDTPAPTGVTTSGAQPALGRTETPSRVKPPSAGLLAKAVKPEPVPEPVPPPEPEPPAEPVGTSHPTPIKAGLVEKGKDPGKQARPSKGAPARGNLKKGLVGKGDAPAGEPTKKGLVDKRAEAPDKPTKAKLAAARKKEELTRPRSEENLEEIRQVMHKAFLEFKPAEVKIVQVAPNAAAQIEERRAPRMKCEYETRCFLGLASFLTQVTEISLTGVRILTPERLTKDAMVELAPVNPNAKLKAVRCRVAWCRKIDDEVLSAGLAFDDDAQHLARSWAAVVLHSLGCGQE